MSQIQMEGKLREGDLVWVSDEDLVYTAARMHVPFQRGSAGDVESVETGQVYSLSAKQSKSLVKADPKIINNNSVKDLTSLNKLNEQSILFSLRKRFLEDQIYTSIGPILISINPFKQLPFYTNDVLQSCIQNSFSSPHVFTLASKCYTQMIQSSKSQSCIVTGESGAGKTEATKLIIQCLTEKAGGGGVKGRLVEKQILEVNPLLEAFGNAKTGRNDNSSRFGKLTRLFFGNNNNNGICGVSIVDYLLEKSRIVKQSEGERNYHCFYQMLTDNTLTQEHGLGFPESFYYLTQNGNADDTVCESINDSDDWKSTLDSMEVLGISAKDVQCIEHVMIGILNLGNVQFKSSGSSAKDAAVYVDGEDSKWMQEACKLLGFDLEKVKKGLLSTALTVRGETTFKMHTAQQAGDARDALAKSIYGALFSYIIKRVNDTLGNGNGNGDGNGNGLSINVLDIFGFESFLLNSFEQLCINYCNEKLQVHFIDHVFKAEEAMYAKEGIKVDPIEFEDTSEVLTIIEGKGSGLFAMLDEQNKLPQGSDKTFLTKVLNNVQKFKCLKEPKGKDVRENPFMAQNFNIKHFAGEVSYHVPNFLEKNSDKLLPSLQDVAASTTFPFMQHLFTAYIQTTKSTKSLGLKFKTQLDSLLKVLNSSEPHFVRTIKPNPEKVKDKFNSQMVLDQIRCAGLLGVCEVHKNGFPMKLHFKDFLFRFNLIVGNGAKTAQDLCAMLQAENLLPQGQWQLGKSQVFMRTAYYEELENIRDSKVEVYAVQIQRIARGYLARKKLKGLREAISTLRIAIGNRDLHSLKSGIDACDNLPRTANLTELLSEAKQVLAELEAENAIQLQQVDFSSSAASPADPDVFLRNFWDKMKSPLGIVTKDLYQFDKNLAQLRQSNSVDNKQAILDKAQNLLEFARIQIQIQEFISVALDTKDPEDLDSALALISQIDLQTNNARQVRNLMADKVAHAQDNGNANDGGVQNLQNLLQSINGPGHAHGGGPVTMREKLLQSTKNITAKGSEGVKNNRFSTVVNMRNSFNPHGGGPAMGSSLLQNRLSGKGRALSMNLTNLMGNGGLQSFSQDLSGGRTGQYNLNTFYLLRPQDEREKLTWTGEELQKSLTVLNDDLNSLALQVNKSILQYTGDEFFQYPASAAQKVLQLGIDNPFLTNELYIQIMKHLTDNEKPNSEDKAWILMILVTQSVPPSAELQPFVHSFLMHHTSKPLVIGNYAKLCLGQMDRTIELGITDTIPDVELVDQYSQRPALLLEIETCRSDYVSGEKTVVSIPCYPDSDVAAIVECAVEVAGFPPNQSDLYGLFVTGKPVSVHSKLAMRLERFYQKWDPSKLEHVEYFAATYHNKENQLFSELIDRYGAEPQGHDANAGNLAAKKDVGDENLFHPIPWWMFPGDLYLKLSFNGKEAKFSLKQKLIFGNESPTRELIEQNRELVQRGELAIISYEDVTELAAIAMTLKKDGPLKTADEALDFGLENFLPQIWLKEQAGKMTAQSICDINLKGKEEVDMQERYITICKKAEGYGVWFFPVSQVKSFSPQDGSETVSQLNYVGVSFKGLHLFDPMRTETVQLFAFDAIAEFGADNDVVWFSFKTASGNQGPKAEFTTQVPWEIYHMVQAYSEHKGNDDTGNQDARPQSAVAFNRNSVFRTSAF